MNFSWSRSISKRTTRLSPGFSITFLEALQLLDRFDAMVAQQGESLRKLTAGFVAGYNRYVRDNQASGKAHAACSGEAWVRPITEQDLLRRMYVANAAGYSNFVAALANAVAPQASAAKDFMNK